MTPKEQAIELLCKGIQATQVADAIGVDPSYVSQLKADPEIAAKIQQSLAANTVADTEFDERLERAEDLALQQIERRLPMANLQQSMQAFRILNGATKRKHQTLNPGAGAGVIVNIHLPASAVPRYTLNAQNEIVDVEGKAMVAASAKSLDEVLAARAAGNTKGLPGITDVEKAAAMLGALRAPIKVPAKKLPSTLSPDIL